MLVSGIGRTEAKPGCYECVVAQDVAEPGRVRYREAWESQDAFQRHVQSDEFRCVLTAIDMCCEEPRVVIGNLSGKGGITYLQELYKSDNGGSD